MSRDRTAFGAFLRARRDRMTPAQAGITARFVQDNHSRSAPRILRGLHFQHGPAQGKLIGVIRGRVWDVAVDIRPDSPTFALKNTMYVGALRPWQLLIPPGVGHGYKVVGETSGVLVYVTNQLYNPRDEGRIAYNDPSIQYDWETQHK